MGSTVRSPLHRARLTVQTQYPAHGRLADSENRRDLYVRQVLLVKRPDDGLPDRSGGRAHPPVRSSRSDTRSDLSHRILR
jgi:hypothetical protein